MEVIIDGIKYVPEQQDSAGEYILTIDNDMDVLVNGKVRQLDSYSFDSYDKIKIISTLYDYRHSLSQRNSPESLASMKESIDEFASMVHTTDEILRGHSLMYGANHAVELSRQFSDG